MVPATTSSTSSVYNFTMRPQHSIPAYGLLQLQVPADLSIASTAVIQSKCLYYLPATGSPLSQFCTVSTTNGVTTINMTLSVAHSSGLSLKVSMQGFKNPRTKGATQSFIITSTAKDGSKIDVSSGTDFTVQMTSLQSLTSMSITAANQTNGATTSYLLTFVSPIALLNYD